MNAIEILSESLITSLPVYIVALIAIFFLRNTFNRYMRMKHDYDYKEDRYRQDLEMKIAKLNQKIEFSDERFKSVNHLVLDGAKIENGMEKQFGITNFESKIVPNSAFVLTPFNEQFDEEYDWVKEFFVTHLYSCTRGDDIKVSSNILGHIVKQMATSEIVVANISGRNPNVFYELGIAHALGKEVIIIAKSSNDITFDVSGGQVVIYSDKDDLQDKLNKWLISSLKGKKRN